MKKFKIFLLLILVSSIAYAQSWKEDFYSAQNKEKKSVVNFYDIQKSFNAYWENYNVKNGYYFENGKKHKAAGWKQFKRWEWLWETRINRITGEFPDINMFEIQENVYKNKDSKVDLSNWISMGPVNSYGGYSGLGRINCIAFHPTNKNIFWIGSPSGGLWKTTDKGGSWQVLNDNLSVIGVSEIVLANDYETSKTIYIATGDRDGGDNYSIGVLKSTDDGVTWNQTGLSFNTANRYRITRLLMHPENGDTLFAATNGGIFRTFDGGLNWSGQKQDTIFFDMEFKPNCEDSVLYTTSYSYYGSPEIFKTSDCGLTWSSVHTFPASASRVELDVAKSDSTVVYAMACTTEGGLDGVYRSDNSGLSFAKVYDGTAANANLLNWSTLDTEDDKTGQGGYDLTLSVSPANKDIVFLGGINTWKSIDGGVNWTAANAWTSYYVYNPDSAAAVHADKHYMEYQDDITLFEANDGGIYRSVDGGDTWTDLSNGLVISQMYRLGLSETVKNEVIAGLQDNGSKLLYQSSWYDVKGGDGMECLIDYTDVKVQYASYINGQIDRTTDRWVDYNLVVDITDTSRIEGGPNGAWVTPYVIDPIDSKTLYLGYEDVWKTTNRGISWTKISNLNLLGKIRSIAIAPKDNNTLYITDYDNFYATTNGGTTWIDLTGKLPDTPSTPSDDPSITYITVDIYNPQKLWISLSGYGSEKTFESSDGGNSWSDISNGLPNVPVNCIIQNKYSQTRQLYVGTDIGVYFKDGNSDWALFSNNLPSVIVTELEIYYNKTTPASSLLFASTYGRGLWRSNVAAFNDISGIESEIESFGIKIYPNPTQGEFSIEASEENKIDEINIFDVAGRLIYAKKPDNDIINTIDLSSQSKGIYIVRLIIKGNRVSSKILLE